MRDPLELSSEAQYEWPTERRGIVGVHSTDCGIRDGERCTCGPLGYRSSVHDPITAARMASPVLESEAAAAAWARSRGGEDIGAGLGPRAVTERPVSVQMEDVIEDFLAAAGDGRARDPSGRRYSRPAVERLAIALRGHVALELGSMPLDAVHPWQVQAFVNELSDSGLSPGRLRAIVAGLRALYAYAIEEGRAEANPVDHVMVPAVDDDGQAVEGAPAPFTTTDQLAAVGNHGTAGFMPDQMLWQLLKIVTVVFILVALVLVAESV
jgi:hypothetical protein